MLSVIGSFAIRNSISDVIIMLAFGVIGYVMEKCDCPTAPVVLTLILGPLAEANLFRTISMGGGSIRPLFTRPISIAFMLITIVSLVASLIRDFRLGGKVKMRNLQHARACWKYDQVIGKIVVFKAESRRQILAWYRKDVRNVSQSTVRIHPDVLREYSTQVLERTGMPRDAAPGWHIVLKAELRVYRPMGSRLLPYVKKLRAGEPRPI